MGKNIASKYWILSEVKLVVECVYFIFQDPPKHAHGSPVRWTMILWKPLWY